MANPIVRHELNSLLKSPRAFFVQIGFAIAISLLVVLKWPTDSLVGITGSQSISVFRIFGYGMLAMIILLVPAFPATSIVRERIKGTLQLLLNSPLSPPSIYFGKAIGLILFVFILFLLSLPAAAACYAMDGVRLLGNNSPFEEYSIVPLYAVLALAAIEYIAIGLLISFFCQSTDSALKNTYLVVFSLAVLTMIPWLFLQGQSGLYPNIADCLRRFSPITAVAELMGHGDIASKGFSSRPTVLSFIILTAILTLIVAGLNIYYLSKRILDRARDQGTITDEQTLGVRAAKRVLYLGFFDPNRRSSGIPFYLNPVLVKEFRTRRFGRLHWIMRLLAVCAIASIALCYFATTGTLSWGIETIGGIMVLLQIALVVLLIPSIASSIISAELESGGWNLLMLTPLSTFRIVFGKLLSVILTALLILIGTLPGYVVLIAIKPELKPQVITVVLTLVIASFVTLSISAAISSLFKKAATSTAVAYAVVIALFAGTFLIWLGKDAPFGYSVVRTALLFNPVSPALEALKTPGFYDYQLSPIGWVVSEMIIGFCLVVFCFRIWWISRPS